jgi:hypothetical protein
LTKANSIDQIISVNYPGRKPGASQPTPLKQNLVPRFVDKIGATLPDEAKVTKWKIYSLIFRDSENS